MNAECRGRRSPSHWNGEKLRKLDLAGKATDHGVQEYYHKNRVNYVRQPAGKAFEMVLAGFNGCRITDLLVLSII